MKKFAALLCILLIASYLFLPCSAETAVNEPIKDPIGVPRSFKTREEYEDFLRGDEYSSSFEGYDVVIRTFGSFNGVEGEIRGSHTFLVSACYAIDENNVSISISNGDEYYHQDKWAVTPDWSQISDMRSVRGTSYPYTEGVVLDVKGVYFLYDGRGNLGTILLCRGEKAYELNGDGASLWQYPRLGKSTLMMRLLDPQTTEAAIDELYARLDGTYKEPAPPSLWLQKPPMLVGLSALSGAAVAAVTAWAITYFVMRKKAKNATRPATCAGIDVPTEDAPPPDGAQDSTPTPPEETPSNTPTDNDNTV